MKLYIDRPVLRSALKVAQKAGERGSLVELETRGGQLRLTVLTETVRLVQDVTANCEAQGSTRVSLAGLADAARRMPDTLVGIVGTAKRVTIESGQASVRLSVSTDEPPKPEIHDDEGLAVECGAGDLLYALGRVSYCVAKGERYGLNGIDMTPDGDGLRLSSSDGHRAASWLMPGDVKGSSRDSLLPLPAAGLIVAALGECGPEDAVTLQIAPAWSSMTVGDLSLLFRGLDGKFPDLSGVVPKLGAGRVVSVDREGMVAAIATADVAHAEAGGSSTMQFAMDDGAFILSMRSVETGKEAQTSMPYAGEARQRFTFGMAPLYLSEALKSCKGETVELHQGHALGPMRIKDDTDGVVVIMPRRVEG